MKNIFENNIKVDELGRVIIADEELLDFISGAVSQGEFGIGDSSDTACHDNAGCSNSECSHF